MVRHLGLPLVGQGQYSQCMADSACIGTILEALLRNGWQVQATAWRQEVAAPTQFLLPSRGEIGCGRAGAFTTARKRNFAEFQGQQPVGAPVPWLPRSGFPSPLQIPLPPAPPNPVFPPQPPPAELPGFSWMDAQQLVSAPSFEMASESPSGPSFNTTPVESLPGELLQDPWMPFPGTQPKAKSKVVTSGTVTATLQGGSDVPLPGTQAKAAAPHWRPALAVG